MARPERIRAGFAAGTSSEVSGYLVKQPVERNIPPARKRFASAKIDCDELIVPVWFYDDLAGWIAGVPADSAVTIKGKLVVHTWKVGKVEHQRLVLRATEGELVERARE